MQLIASDNRRIVIGLGATGLSCARFLAARGEPFAAADSRTDPPGLDAFRREFPDVSLQLGDFDLDQFTGFDELIVSPGVSLREPAIAAAAAEGVKVSGDIALFCDAAKAPIAAITGSNGKSTVTTLVGNMAHRAGRRVAVGGNLGTPALELLAADVELYVLELSSFQLERCESVGAEVAALLNISEDHIDHHGSLLAYHQAKQRIFRGCRKAVFNREDPLTQPLVPGDVQVWRFGTGAPDLNDFGVVQSSEGPQLAFGHRPIMPVSELKIAGSHNIANALAAVAIARALDVDYQHIVAELRAFEGLPHRCQFVGELDGIRFYDDSKGTNVGAAVAAIRGLGESDSRVVLVAGGQGKGSDFEPLIDCLRECGRAAVFIGEAAGDLDELLDGDLPSERAGDMETAVAAARRLARRGDVVLLSPACASFDMFRDYRERGDTFQAAVRRLGDGGSA